MPAVSSAKPEQNASSTRDWVFAVRLDPAVKRALSEAARRSYESRADYLRRSLVQRLRADGLLPERPAVSLAGAAEEMSQQAAAERQ